jgi:hypothetical protein
MNKKERWFLKEFLSGDNSKVNSMAVISMLLAAPIVTIAAAALLYHIFYLHKGLDSPSVQLLIALITAATGGLGASMFSRTLGFGGFYGSGGEVGPRPKVPPQPRRDDGV